MLPNYHARVRKASIDLHRLAAEYQEWLAAGLPKREPITQEEVSRRITLLREAASMLVDPLN